MGSNEEFRPLPARKSALEELRVLDVKRREAPRTQPAQGHLSPLLDAVMGLLPQQEKLALRQTFYGDPQFQQDRAVLNPAGKTAEEMTQQALATISRPEIQASLRQLSGGHEEIFLPEKIKITRIGEKSPTEVTKAQFVNEVMEAFKAKFLSPSGIAEALGCDSLFVYFVIISKLYEQEMAARSGAEQAQTPNENPLRIKAAL